MTGGAMKNRDKRFIKMCPAPSWEKLAVRRVQLQATNHSQRPARARARNDSERAPTHTLPDEKLFHDTVKFLFKNSNHAGSRYLR